MSRQTFTRSTLPDLAALATTIKPTIGDPFWLGTQIDGGTLKVWIEKPTAWLAGDITAVQSAVTACADATPQTEAQNEIDQMSVFQKAILLTLLDQINTL